MFRMVLNSSTPPIAPSNLIAGLLLLALAPKLALSSSLESKPSILLWPRTCDGFRCDTVHNSNHAWYRVSRPQVSALSNPREHLGQSPFGISYNNDLRLVPLYKIHRHKNGKSFRRLSNILWTGTPRRPMLRTLGDDIFFLNRSKNASQYRRKDALLFKPGHFLRRSSRPRLKHFWRANQPASDSADGKRFHSSRPYGDLYRVGGFLDVLHGGYHGDRAYIVSVPLLQPLNRKRWTKNSVRRRGVGILPVVYLHLHPPAEQRRQFSSRQTPPPTTLPARRFSVRAQDEPKRNYSSPNRSIRLYRKLSKSQVLNSPFSRYYMLLAKDPLLTYGDNRQVRYGTENLKHKDTSLFKTRNTEMYRRTFPGQYKTRIRTGKERQERRKKSEHGPKRIWPKSYRLSTRAPTTQRTPYRERYLKMLREKQIRDQQRMENNKPREKAQDLLKRIPKFRPDQSKHPHSYIERFLRDRISNYSHFLSRIRDKQKQKQDRSRTKSQTFSNGRVNTPWFMRQNTSRQSRRLNQIPSSLSRRPEIQGSGRSDSSPNLSLKPDREQDINHQNPCTTFHGQFSPLCSTYTKLNRQRKTQDKINKLPYGPVMKFTPVTVSPTRQPRRQRFEENTTRVSTVTVPPTSSSPPTTTSTAPKTTGHNHRLRGDRKGHKLNGSHHFKAVCFVFIFSRCSMDSHINTLLEPRHQWPGPDGGPKSLRPSCCGLL
ncbi:hypothetical protein PoB_001790000 [Plakobranchus ocellatus]|uniref:Uncharacterized protein n=1 Tax=Plakobranchus ocellatus TaxID=259542 RepID=A0AAV3Z8B6_9GAST|nr:hypothetical protein PoB_001790000 [Plakobranchus ocellatus]